MADKVVHFHGGPIVGAKGAAATISYRDGGAFISYLNTDQISKCFEICKEVALDNGAFSAWKQKKTIDWSNFYKWIEKYYDNPKLRFFVIPDVVEGGEEDNDKLISEVPEKFKDKAAPVWHLHESIERLVRLCEQWPTVCFGSSGEYAVTRTKRWHARMNEAFTAIYIDRNLPVKIHGLRMLDGRIVGNYPLNSADSCNLAINIPKYNSVHPQITQNVINAGWDKYEIYTHRAAILRNAIESVRPPTVEEWVCRMKESSQSSIKETN